ncbi:MAG: pyruvate:ferredoxin (flavodoxin) oxidoreductase [Gammaproteobacteria bacterium]
MTENNKKQISIDGNEACASVAYRVTDLNVIYPITPSSTMGELADLWSSEGKKNIWGRVPQVMEMQSEGGAIGAMHGALQCGTLTTSYTASQGLLLMIPNMYKIAGELTSAVLHVSARSLATQGLSIFGDHSDVMAVRSTGWAMLCSANVQEAHDMALIAHSSTLESRIPFVHFFDGFRTSHEINKIESLSDDILHAFIDDELVAKHRERALDPDHPFIRGTAQNPDVYFLARETSNLFYTATPAIVEKNLKKLKELTGRNYDLVEYFGAKDAEYVIVIMGSGAITVRETVRYLETQGKKVGVLQVRLFRPFPSECFLAALPKSVRAIAVLDRTKEPGSLGEPLYQDVITALEEAKKQANSFTNGMPNIIGGRYGLGSKEFTPAMVKAVFDELSKEQTCLFPANHFTVGINDDVSKTSLPYDPTLNILSDKVTQALFYGLGSDGTVGANKNTIKIIGEETDLYTQGYFVYDSKKSGSQTVSHLRFGPEPILAPYLITKANFIGCHHFPFVKKINVLEHATENAVFLLNSPHDAASIWKELPCPIQETIIQKKIKFYVIDAYKVAEENGMGGRTNTIMQTCFFAISNVLPKEDAITKIKKSIQKTYSKKGEEVVKKNFAAVDATLANLKEVIVPKEADKNACQLQKVVSAQAPDFVKKVLAPMMAGHGDDLPVSALPNDGTYPTATTKWEKRNISLDVSDWNPELCIQCGQCGLVCPHAVLRAKYYSPDLLAKAPSGFKSAPARDKKLGDDKKFTLQVYLEDCTGCGLCQAICPGVSKTDPKEKAIMIKEKEPFWATGKENVAFFDSLPNNDRTNLDLIAGRHLQYLEPLFEFSGACAGCGETPYVKILSQMFGDRMLVANATGCSSIYGGNLPTTPWAKNSQGQGPAWSNSLFEDNAEFGLGFRLAEDIAVAQALELLQELRSTIGEDLVRDLTAGAVSNDEKSIATQRERVKTLQNILQKSTDEKSKRLSQLADHLVKRSIWILGGDGWAYDIGYGGLDHVLASGRKVNVMVLDTEVYSNTGGQASKSTPLGAVAKFAESGKPIARKDLGLMMTTYRNIYVAQIALGANQAQALRAIKEAESYSGPSIIIAYSNCISHGIDMSTGLTQQKLAVQSGFWPLYRYNPDRRKENLNPLQLDSGDPSIAFKDYAYNENRFKSLLKRDPKRAEELMTAAQKDIEEKWKLLKKMAEENK